MIFSSALHDYSTVIYHLFGQNENDLERSAKFRLNNGRPFELS